MKTVRIEISQPQTSWRYECDECGSFFISANECERHEAEHRVFKLAYNKAADAYYLKTTEDANALAKTHYAYCSSGWNRSEFAAGWYTYEVEEHNDEDTVMYLTNLDDSIKETERKVERLDSQLAALKNLTNPA